jgi:glutathione synthase/RimK-type ligase-like ATP-grasp enzyme
MDEVRGRPVRQPRKPRQPVLAGIDVIGDHLTEVNVTSPTGVREIDALCGTTLADLIVEHIEQRCQALRAHPA